MDNNSFEIRRKFMDLLSLYNTMVVVAEYDADDVDFETALNLNLGEVLHQMEIYLLNKIANKIKNK